MKHIFVSILLFIIFSITIPANNNQNVLLLEDRDVVALLSENTIIRSSSDSTTKNKSYIRLSDVLKDEHNYHQWTFLLLCSIAILIVTTICIIGIIYFKKQITKRCLMEKNNNLQKKYNPPEKLQQEEIDLFTELENLMTEKKIFLKFDITLDSLAKKMKVPRNLLSHIINQQTGKNFNQYINEFRIKEIIDIISSNNCIHKNIEEIAEQGGFNSRSAFYSAFKSFTGLTPSQFKPKNLQ